MTIRQMKCAVLLAQTRNFSKVAEELEISQPTLSKHISNLEQELGVQLFDREHVPLAVTPAGEFFVKEAQELLYKGEQLLKALECFKTGENGSLSVGTTPFRSLYLMPELVKNIKKKYPGVKVVLHEENTATLRREAAEGRFDFAIVNLPVDDSLLEATPLERDVLVLAVPNSMLSKLKAKKDKAVITMEDAKSLPFVILGQNQELRELFDKLCTLHEVQPTIVAEVVGVTTAWTMTCEGVGATILPLQFVKNNDIKGEVTLFELENDIYTRQPAIVTRRGQYLSPYAKYAIEYLQERYGPKGTGLDF